MSAFGRTSTAHQLKHAGDSFFPSWCSHFHRHVTIKVQCSAEDIVARRFRHGPALSCKDLLVNFRSPTLDVPIHSKPLTRQYAKFIAPAHRLPRYLKCLSGANHTYRFGQQFC